MGLTISHESALRVLRQLRAEGNDVHAMDHTAIARPTPWVGKHWTMRAFASEAWRWPAPSKVTPLHVLVRASRERMRVKGVCCHTCSLKLPARAVLWLDEHASMSGPELLFVQMAETLPLPALVGLGYELCGHFTRSANDPIGGPVVDSIRAATSKDELRSFVQAAVNLAGIPNARRALEYIEDHAVSVPEATLATIYSLPPEESGYGMGPVRLNTRVAVDGKGMQPVRNRYPDLMFSFAPVGINYDGEGHLDLAGLARTAQQAALADGPDASQARMAFANKLEEVRAKFVDDTRRNRELAGQGRLVFPLTKEDLYDASNLDDFTRQILHCANSLLGTDIRRFEAPLDDTSLTRERHELLRSMLTTGLERARSY